MIWLAIVLAMTAACGAVGPSPTPVPPPACPTTTEPGPNDEPPGSGGDLIDVADFGAGRYRLCLTNPPVGDVEHSAWCQWTEDRTLVRDINGLPMRLGGVAYQGWYELGNGEFELGATDALGRVSTYRAADAALLREIGKDGRDGHVAFAVELQIDPESGAHPGASLAFTGAMSWTCGDPPPPG